MDRLFTIPLPVAPFLIGPNAQLGTEVAYIFAPTQLTSNRNAPRALLFDPVVDGHVLSPVVGQICRLSSAVVATTTIRTSSHELATGRSGQELIIGVRAEPAAFLGRGWVLSRAHRLLYDFLEQAFGADLSSNGASFIVESIQRSRDLNAAILDKLGYLLAAFEQAFFTGYTSKSDALSRLRLSWRVRSFLSERRTLPAATHRDLLGYWSFVDEHLQRKRPDGFSSSQPKGA